VSPVLRSLATSGSVTLVLSCVAVVKRLELLVQRYGTGVASFGGDRLWSCNVLFVRRPDAISHLSLGRHGKATAVNTVMWGAYCIVTSDFGQHFPFYVLCIRKT